MIQFSYFYPFIQSHFVIRNGFRKYFNFRGIGFRYGLLFVTGMIFIYIIAFFITLNFTRNILQEDSRREATNLTNLTIAKIQNVLNPIEFVPLSLARSLEAGSIDYDQVRQSLKEFVRLNDAAFGSCIAFEPGRYSRDMKYFAPYYYDVPGGLEMKFLGGPGYDYFSKEWYRIPAESGKPVWTEPYYDTGGGDTLMCTYAVPFYRMEKGQRIFTGVITVDISLSAFQRIVGSVHLYRSGTAFLISSKGKIITYPGAGKESVNIFSLLQSSHSEHYIPVIRKLLNGETGYLRFVRPVNGVASWLSYAPVPSTNWAFGLIFPERDLFSSLYEFFYNLAFVSLLSIFAIFILTIFLTGRLTLPIRRLVDATGNIGKGKFDVMLPSTRSRDEIAQLTGSFRVMQEELRKYMENLKETTSAKERIESELSVAESIQMGLLPSEFPVRPEGEVYALLKPARYIGGDLYDFFFLDKDQLFIAIGDVSGKGVPASLFMAITRTLFRAGIDGKRPLNEVVSSVNRELCRENPTMVFVTFLCGIVDMRTGRITVCNAGHNFPLIRRADGHVTSPRWESGFPLGLFKDALYHSHEIALVPGDELLLYTDGVTEARDASFRFFGEAGLEKSFSGAGDGSSVDACQRILRDVTVFSAGTEQWDDITMLVFGYTGREQENIAEGLRRVLIIQNRVEEIHKMADWLKSMATEWFLSRETVMDLNLVLEELVSNIIFYAFDDDKRHDIFIEFNKWNDLLRIKVTDDGRPFDPSRDRQSPDIETGLKERKVGGLGIHFVRTKMDVMEYRRDGEFNKVILTKKIT